MNPFSRPEKAEASSGPSAGGGAGEPAPARKLWRPPAPQTREVIRSWDRRATEELGIPGLILMENAGLSAERIIEDLISGEPEAYREPFLVVCGPGQNGGDGFAVARHLHTRGFETAIRVAPGVEYDPGSASGVNFEIVKRLGLEIRELDPGDFSGGGTVIDALFGTGLSRPLRSPFLEWVQAINAKGRTVIALDVPSGLDADTGEILGEAIRASDTITFAASKRGFELARGPECCGRVHVVDIGMPRELTRGS